VSFFYLRISNAVAVDTAERALGMLFMDESSPIYAQHEAMQGVRRALGPAGEAVAPLLTTPVDLYNEYGKSRAKGVNTSIFRIPVFSVYTVHKFRFWRKYGADGVVSPSPGCAVRPVASKSPGDVAALEVAAELSAIFTPLDHEAVAPRVSAEAPAPMPWEAETLEAREGDIRTPPFPYLP